MRVIYSICHLRMQAYHSDVLAKQVSWNLQLIGTQLRRNWHGYLCLCLDEWTVSLLSLLPCASPGLASFAWHTLPSLSLSLSAQGLGRDVLCCDGDALCRILCGVYACMPLFLLLLWLLSMSLLLTLYSASSGVDSHSNFLVSIVCSNLSGGLTPFGSFSSSLVSACVIQRFPLSF